MLVTPKEQFEKNFERSLKERWGYRSGTLYTPGDQKEIERYARERGYKYKNKFPCDSTTTCDNTTTSNKKLVKHK